MSERTKITTKLLTNFRPRIRDKIRLDPVGVDETSAHWMWTGAFSPARRRYRAYPVSETRESYTDKTGSFQSERGSTKIHCTELGYAAQGHRVVFAEARGLPITEVPELRRCDDARCVSPYHHWPIGPVPTRGRKPAAERAQRPPGLEMLLALPEDNQPDEAMEDRTLACLSAMPAIDPKLVSDAAWLAFRKWKYNQA